MLEISDPELWALATGETVVVFAPRGTVDEGDEVGLRSAGPRPPSELKPAYQRLAAEAAPDGSWSAVVVSVDPAALLDPAAGSARHILATAGNGDLVVLRVYDGAGRAVLSDAAFEARRRSVEGALRQ